MRAILVPGHNPGPFTLAGTNTWLLPGSRPTLVDAGLGVEAHLRDLREAVTTHTVGELAQVLVTHAHADHIGGAPGIAAQYPAATFFKLSWPELDAPTGVTFQPLADDQPVPAGDGTLWAIHTPGHAPDHLCFFDTRTGVLFAGDLVMNGSTVVIPASKGGSLVAYLGSLRRVLELQPRRILPAHGDPIDNPAALLRGYIAHRMARERQILGALGAGPTSPEALVDVIYPGLDVRVRRFARESIVAHLLKLQADGAARVEESGLWQLVT
jgi:hydroxyacylglutathione hydrolase